MEDCSVLPIFKDEEGVQPKDQVQETTSPTLSLSATSMQDALPTSREKSSRIKRSQEIYAVKETFY